MRCGVTRTGEPHADIQLMRRAMLFLKITGEVLCPQLDQDEPDEDPGALRRQLTAPTLGERVFLRPQWLVDVEGLAGSARLGDPLGHL